MTANRQCLAASLSTHRGHVTPMGCRGLFFFLEGEITMATETLFISVVAQPRFPTGQLVMTTGVDELVRQGRLNPSSYLRRHLSADWGDLDDRDRRSNDAALQSGEDRLFSSY